MRGTDSYDTFLNRKTHIGDSGSHLTKEQDTERMPFSPAHDLKQETSLAQLVTKLAEQRLQDDAAVGNHLGEFDDESIQVMLDDTKDNKRKKIMFKPLHLDHAIDFRSTVTYRKFIDQAHSST